MPRGRFTGLDLVSRHRMTWRSRPGCKMYLACEIGEGELAYRGDRATCEYLAMYGNVCEVSLIASSFR